MKKLILSLLCCAAAFPFTACEGDGDHHRAMRTTTTTTEESTIQRPVSGSVGVETTAVRTY